MMRLCDRCLWPVAVACFTVAVVLMLARPAWAETDAIGGTYTWAQVVILVGVGAAWGDMRRQMADLRRDVDDMRKRGDD